MPVRVVAGSCGGEQVQWRSTGAVVGLTADVLGLDNARAALCRNRKAHVRNRRVRGNMLGAAYCTCPLHQHGGQRPGLNED